MEKVSKTDIAISYVLKACAVAMVIYHLVFARYPLQSPLGNQNTHLAFSLMLVFLSEIKGGGKKSIFYFILFILSIAATGYVQFQVDALDARCMMNTGMDIFIGGILLVVVFAGAWKAFGAVLPIIASFFVFYTYLGHFLPQPFQTMQIGIDELIIKLSIGLTGMYGPILNVSAVYVFLFMIFAALITATGALDFFVQIGKFVGRYFRAGPAMAAVLTSGMMGSITGSAGANVMITGSFTIPSMKRIGYRPEQAGGIEAAASTGGPIIPPVMGVAAFIMSAVTGIEYSKIIGVAVIPAVLYVVTCAAYTELQARKLGIQKVDEKVDVKLLMQRLPLFAVSFLLIIVLFLLGYSPMFVGFSACIALFLMSLLRKDTRLPFGALISALTEGALTGASVGITCALLGLVVDSISMSGLGVVLPKFIAEIFGHNLALLLLATAFVSIILGCGLPASASYLLVAIVLAPILVKSGVKLLPAHFFAFFFANFSFITPPVAISALFGAKLAEASYMKTAFEAAKVGIAGFILPFIIIFCPAVMLDFSHPVLSVFMIVGIFVALIILQAFIIGHFITGLNILERALALTATIILLSFIFTSSFYLFWIGMVIGGMFCFWQIFKTRKPMALSTNNTVE